MKLISGIIVAAIFAVMTFGRLGVPESPGERAALAGAYPGRRLLALRGRQNPFGSKDSIG